MVLTLMSAQAGLSLLSRLRRLSRVSSDRLNLARNSPSLAPSATRLRRVWARTVQVFMLLLVFPRIGTLYSELERVKTYQSLEKL